MSSSSSESSSESSSDSSAASSSSASSRESSRESSRAASLAASADRTKTVPVRVTPRLARPWWPESVPTGSARTTSSPSFLTPCTGKDTAAASRSSGNPFPALSKNSMYTALSDLMKLNQRTSNGGTSSTSSRSSSDDIEEEDHPKPGTVPESIDLLRSDADDNDGMFADATETNSSSFSSSSSDSSSSSFSSSSGSSSSGSGSSGNKRPAQKLFERVSSFHEKIRKRHQEMPRRGLRERQMMRRRAASIQATSDVIKKALSAKSNIISPIRCPLTGTPYPPTLTVGQLQSKRTITESASTTASSSNSKSNSKSNSNSNNARNTASNSADACTSTSTDAVIDLCNSEDEASNKPIPKPNPGLEVMRLLIGARNTNETPPATLPKEASPIPKEKRQSIVLRIPLRRLVVRNTQDPVKRYNRTDHQPVLWLKQFCDPETTVYSFHDLDFTLDLPKLGDDDFVHRRVLTRVGKAIRFTTFQRQAAENPATGVGSFCRLRGLASPASTLDDPSPQALKSSVLLEFEANADFDAVVKAFTHVSDRGLMAVGSLVFGSVLARDLLGSDPREDESIIKAQTAKSPTKYPRPFSQLDDPQPAKKHKASSEAKDVASPVTTTTVQNAAKGADTAPGFEEQPTAVGEQQPDPVIETRQYIASQHTINLMRAIDLATSKTKYHGATPSSSEKRKSETEASNRETQTAAEEPSPKKQKIAPDDDDRSAPIDHDNRSSEPPKESQEQPPTPVPASCRDAEESASANVASLPFSWDGTFRIIGQSDSPEDTKEERSASESVATKQSKSESESKPSPSKEAAEDAGDHHEATEYTKVQFPLCDTENRVPEDESPSSEEHPSVEEENEAENEGEVPADSDSDRLETGLEVESRDEEELRYRNNEGQLRIVREVRALLGDIVSSIVERAGGRRQETARDIGDGNDDNDENELWNFMTERMVRPENNLLLKYNAEEAEAEDLAAELELDEQEQDHDPITAISMGSLLVLALPLACLAGMFARLGLVDLSNSILEGCFRSFLQLSVLGWLLSPIFRWGNRYPVLVAIYSLFMIALASYEASSRTKYTHEDQLYVVAKSLAMNVGWIVLWAFGVVLKPKPLWNPRYLVPIVGMLLANSINGVSIALDTLTTSLVERRAEVDLYLSFGATQYEAVSGMVAHAIQKGATPSLNIMCVVGIVSIPGMMTGQILGGSRPMVAARYQAMMLVLIALATLSTIFVSSSLTVLSAFCSHQILRPERLVRNRKRSLGRLILWAWGYVFGGIDNVPMGAKLGSMGESSMTPTASKTNFHVLSVRKGYDNGGDVLLQAMDLGKHFGDEKDVVAIKSLFYGFSLDIDEGDLYFVSGPNGSGKSQLLRILAGLSPFQDGSLRLEGKDWEKDYDGKLAVTWRKDIRYVPQTRVQIPGTPRQFIRRIRSFHSWRESDTDEHRYRQALYMNHRILQYLDQWGLGPDCLDRDWSMLSGGESQRVLIAIAMASRPKLLLFDESTSALDPGSKLAVEASVMEYVENYEGGVVWVSHEEEQADRMKLTMTAAMHPGPSTVIEEVPIPSVGIEDVPRPYAGVEEGAYYPRPSAVVEEGPYYY